MNLQAFRFDMTDVRCVMRDDQPWFVAADVCAALEHGNVSQALSRLDEDEKMTLTIDEGHSGQRGGAQFLNIVSEPGLYSLVLTSRKPEAKRFKRWITHEVLPALRKTGEYRLQRMPEDPRELGLPDFRNPAVAAIAYGETLLKLQATEAVVQQLKVEKAANEAELSVTKPKAEAYQRLTEAPGCLNLQTAGKTLGHAPNKFIRWLKTWALHYRGRSLVPYQRLIEQDYFEVRLVHRGDEVFSQTLVTAKGMAMLARRLNLLQNTAEA